LETEDGTGFDINGGAISLISGGLEIDKNGVNTEGSILGITENAESTRGASYGQSVGSSGLVPISANAGYSEEYQVIDGKTVSTKKEVSSSGSITGSPLGVFVSGEQTKNSNGSTNTTVRVAPFNLAVTLGGGLTIQGSVSFGLKIEHKDDN
jgi:hypothetical protein